jgi:16S rRNA processing protein RimM
MMNPSDFFYLGKVVKTHGIHGELSGFVDADDPLIYSELHAVFIQLKEGLIPFVFERISIDEKGYSIFKVKGIDTIEAAKKLTGKPMFLPLSMLPALNGSNFYYHEVKGFRVKDTQYGFIGTIIGVIEHPRQSLLQIDFNGDEVLIPIHDDIILNVDRVEKIIEITAPEGLIEVYLDKS